MSDIDKAVEMRDWGERCIPGMEGLYEQLVPGIQK